jgi:hypothetical protein
VTTLFDAMSLFLGHASPRPTKRRANFQIDFYDIIFCQMREPRRNPRWHRQYTDPHRPQDAEPLRLNLGST